MPKKRKKKIKMKCELCPRNHNSVEFENHYTINGKKFCSKCFTRLLRNMNEWKKDLPPYGKDMKVLEEMVKIKLFEFPTMNRADIRKKAIKRLIKQYPVIFKGYSNL